MNHNKTTHKLYRFNDTINIKSLAIVVKIVELVSSKIPLELEAILKE